MFIAIVAFLLIFSLVVLVHELGHFYWARKTGVKVEEFGFGLPPRIWGKKRGDTIYSINWIPFGGFVRLYGEGSEFQNDKQAFAHKKPIAKLAIVVGGVVMNFVLGLVVMMIGFWSGMPPLATPVEQYVADSTRIESQVLVVGTVNDSAAIKAGLLPGDFIISADDQKFNVPSELKTYIQSQGFSPIQLIIMRDRQSIPITVTPARNDKGEAEIGVLLDRHINKVAYVWWQVPWLAWQETVRVLGLVIISIASFLYRLFTTASLPVEISGPVGIAKITAEVVRLGWFRVLQFVIFLSLNLGVINLVPFPGLDGGRLMFVLMEFFRKGKRLPGNIENTINTLGVILLVLLIVVVTYKDIIKII